MSLELVETNELIQELMKRFDAMVLSTEIDETKNNQITRYHFSGGLSRAIGMLEKTKQKLLSMGEEVEGDDDGITR